MNDSKKNDNVPPNSRLFIVCGKTVEEEDFRDAFSTFGQVESVQIHKDRKGESKGIAYVKFSKTSEAALAVEEMNGRCIGHHPRPLKVMVAHAKDQGSSRESNEEERLLRLFVVVGKDVTEDELKADFEAFGTVQYVNIVKDRVTKESKGFAYIKFYRLVHAAKAFESCDKSYKAVFAEPRPARQVEENNQHLNHHHHQGVNNHHHHGNHNNHINRNHHGVTNGFQHPSSRSTGSSQFASESCRLTVLGSLAVNEDQLWRLFDLIPGLDYCEVREVDQPNQRMVGLAVYTNPNSAAYARKKLHGFEYPPGQRLIVKHDEGGGALAPSPASSTPPPPSLPLPSDLQSLADSIAQATSLIQAANFQEREPSHHHQGSHTSHPPPTLTIGAYDPAYCSISLPSPQPLAPMETLVSERLFLVCTPGPPPIYALKDVFGRFGGLIDVYLLKGKRCGYALFSSSESAEEARTALNGQEVLGSRMKVMLAEPSRSTEKEQEDADVGRGEA